MNLRLSCWARLSCNSPGPHCTHQQGHSQQKLAKYCREVGQKWMMEIPFGGLGSYGEMSFYFNNDFISWPTFWHKLWARWGYELGMQGFWKTLDHCAASCGGGGCSRCWITFHWRRFTTVDLEGEQEDNRNFKSYVRCAFYQVSFQWILSCIDGYVVHIYTISSFFSKGHFGTSLLFVYVNRKWTVVCFRKQ